MTETLDSWANVAPPRRPAQAGLALALDHLIVLARTLDEGTEYVADALAVDPVDGAAHTTMGTHERLVGCWGGHFIRIVAPDPGSLGATRARWFGFDSPGVQWRLAAGPFLAHWVVRLPRPRQLALWQSQYPARLAPLAHVRAGGCAWQAGVPRDGAFPAWQGAGDGIVPSVVQYDTLARPADALPATGLQLTGLTGLHPRADVLAPHLAWLGVHRLIALERSPREPSLAAHFDTRFGPRMLK